MLNEHYLTCKNFEKYAKNETGYILWFLKYILQNVCFKDFCLG